MRRTVSTGHEYQCSTAKAAWLLVKELAFSIWNAEKEACWFRRPNNIPLTSLRNQMSASPQWQWENATAGAVAGFATVAAMHPLDVVRTRFQVNDGRISNLPTYKNTAHAVFTIARLEVKFWPWLTSCKFPCVFFLGFTLLCVTGPERTLCRLLSCCSRFHCFLGFIFFLVSSRVLFSSAISHI